MFKYSNKLTLTIALLLCSAASSQAGFSITLHEAGYADQVLTPSLSGGQYNAPTTLFGDYSVQISGGDSAPGSNQFQGGPTISQNTFSVSAVAGSPKDLVITVQDNNFTNVFTAPASVTNHLAGSQIDAGTVSAFSFVNTIGNATSSVSILPLNGGSVYSQASLATGAGSTFTLGNQATISGLLKGGVDNFTVTTVAAVPAPPTLVAALAALPCLGLGHWFRRRKAKVSGRPVV